MNELKDCFSKPIKIIDVSKKGFNYKFLISTLIALASTGLLVWKEVKHIEVYGKVISKTYSEVATLSYQVSPKEYNTIKGQQYILKLALTCLNKNLSYKNVKVYVTYQNEKVPGHIYWSNYDSISFHNPDGTISRKRMKIPASEFLTFNSVLQTDKVNLFYIKFIVPEKQGPKLYDKLELDFIKVDNGSIKVEITDIDRSQYLFEEKLFE